MVKKRKVGTYSRVANGPYAMTKAPRELESELRKVLALKYTDEVYLTPTFLDASAFMYKNRVYIKRPSPAQDFELEPALEVETVDDLTALTGDDTVWVDAFVKDILSGTSNHLPALHKRLLAKANAVVEDEGSNLMANYGPREGIGCDDCGDKRPGWIELLSSWVPCDCNPDEVS